MGVLKMSKKTIGVWLYNPLYVNSTKKVETDEITVYLIKRNQKTPNVCCGCMCDIIIADTQFDDDFISYVLIPCLKKGGKIEFI